MGLSQATTAVMVFLTGLLPASCHKSADPTKTTPPVPAIVITSNAAVTSASAATNAVSAKVFDGNLGEISLTNHSETSVPLPDGQICILTPKLLDRNTVRITLTLESKNGYGETHNFAATQVVAKPGKPVEVTLGNLSLTFTPRVVSE